MKKTFSIAKLAKITNVNQRTLRDWAEYGLVNRIKNPENGYYEYDDNSRDQVLVISLYRSMDMSLNEIKTLLSLTSKDQLITIWEDISQRIKRRILELNNNLDIVYRQIEYTHKVTDYVNTVMEQKPPFDTLHKMQRNEPVYEDLTYISKRVELYTFSEDIPIPLAWGEIEGNGEVLWRFDSEASYFKSVCTIVTSNPQIELNDFIKDIRRRGFVPNKLFFKYLTSIPEGDETTNYFDTWIEAYPQSKN